MLNREWFAETMADLRFTFRQLGRVPVFTVTAITTLALGIGANVTMFGVVDRLLLQPPAHVREPGRVMSAAVTWTGSNLGQHTQRVLSFPIFLDLHSDSSFAAVASYGTATLSSGVGPSAREVRGMRVTPAYFAVLGPRPVIGSFFDPTVSPDQPAINQVVVSEEYWRSELGGSADVLGRHIDLSGAQYEVIGVAPRGFTGGRTSLTDVWIPYAAGATPARIAEWKEGRQWYSLRVVARLADDVPVARATSTASLAVQRGELRDGLGPEDVARRNATVSLTSMEPREARGDDADSRVALLLAAMSLFVLLLACANVTNLQLGRAVRRYREVSIRLALGVSRRRLIRLLLTESIVLAIIGGGAAILVAWWGTRVMHATLLANLELVSAAVDGRMVVYASIMALAIGIVTGLVPAMQSSRPDLISSLRTGGQPAGQRSALRRLLLVTQSGLALVLLVGTGLFVRSVQRINAVPLGLDPGQVIVASLNTTGRDYDDAALTRMYRDLARSLAGTPGVEQAAVTYSLSFGAQTAASVVVPGLDSLPLTSEGGPYVNVVGPGYFEVLRIPMVAGRPFTADDRAGSEPVAIVNETAARLWWPGEPAVGKCLRFLDETMPCATVVGVTANSRRQSIVEDEYVQVFGPAEQAAWANPRIVIARVRGNPHNAAREVQRSVQASSGLPYVTVTAMADRLSSQTRSWRLGAMMFGIFGVLAIVLAAIGLYGVLAFDVSQRTREIGVRLALGGAPVHIAAHVVRQGLAVAVIGCILGLAVVLVTGARVRPLLFQTSPFDVVVAITALTVILVTAVVASWIPARRAGRVDPAIALQSD
jgi:predicted permease